MTERALETGQSLLISALAVDAPQAVKEPPPSSRAIRHSQARLLRVLTPLALAVGALVIASGCGKGEDKYETWTGILNVREDCMLIPPTTPSATSTPVYWEHCPLKYSLTDKDGKTYILEGEGEGFPDVLGITADELKQFKEKVDAHLAEVTGTRELNPIQVESYKILTPYSFSDFREDVKGYVESNYPCLDQRSENRLPEDEPLGLRESTYTWDLEDGTRLILQLIDTSGRYDPPPSLKIISEGDGNFNAETVPDNLKVCPE